MERNTLEVCNKPKGIEIEPGSSANCDLFNYVQMIPTS